MRAPYRELLEQAAKGKDSLTTFLTTQSYETKDIDAAIDVAIETNKAALLPLCSLQGKLSPSKLGLVKVLNLGDLALAKFLNELKTQNAPTGADVETMLQTRLQRILKRSGVSNGYKEDTWALIAYFLTTDKLSQSLRDNLLSEMVTYERWTEMQIVCALPEGKGPSQKAVGAVLLKNHKKLNVVEWLINIKTNNQASAEDIKNLLSLLIQSAGRMMSTWEETWKIIVKMGHLTGDNKLTSLEIEFALKTLLQQIESFLKHHKDNKYKSSILTHCFGELCALRLNSPSQDFLGQLLKTCNFIETLSLIIHLPTKNAPQSAHLNNLLSTLLSRSKQGAVWELIMFVSILTTPNKPDRQGIEAVLKATPNLPDQDVRKQNIVLLCSLPETAPRQSVVGEVLQCFHAEVAMVEFFCTLKTENRPTHEHKIQLLMKASQNNSVDTVAYLCKNEQLTLDNVHEGLSVSMKSKSIKVAEHYLFHTEPAPSEQFFTSIPTLNEIFSFLNEVISQNRKNIVEYVFNHTDGNMLEKVGDFLQVTFEKSARAVQDYLFQFADNISTEKAETLLIKAANQDSSRVKDLCLLTHNKPSELTINEAFANALSIYRKGAIAIFIDLHKEGSIVLHHPLNFQFKSVAVDQIKPALRFYSQDGCVAEEYGFIHDFLCELPEIPYVEEEEPKIEEPKIEEIPICIEPQRFRAVESPGVSSFFAGSYSSKKGQEGYSKDLELFFKKYDSTFINPAPSDQSKRFVQELKQIYYQGFSGSIEEKITLFLKATLVRKVEPYVKSTTVTLLNESGLLNEKHKKLFQFMSIQNYITRPLNNTFDKVACFIFLQGKIINPSSGSKALISQIKETFNEDGLALAIDKFIETVSSPNKSQTLSFLKECQLLNNSQEKLLEARLTESRSLSWF